MWQVPKCETVDKNICNPVTRSMCQLVQRVRTEEETEEVLFSQNTSHWDAAWPITLWHHQPTNHPHPPGVHCGGGGGVHGGASGEVQPGAQEELWHCREWGLHQFWPRYLVLCIVLCWFFCRCALPSRGKCALMSQSRSAGKTFWWWWWWWRWC